MLSVNNYLVGRAGHRARPNGLADIKLITLHVQEGSNNLPQYFASISDDATMWADRDGSMHRMLLDSDIPYTNGDAYEPLSHTPYLQKTMWSQGVTNTNQYALTIETAGYASPADAVNHGADATLGTITQQQYVALVEQSYAWCVQYKLPADAIVKHGDVGAHKFCPGQAVNVEAIREEVRARLNANTVSTVKPTPPPAVPSVVYFKETGHSVGGGFLSFWTKNGGLPIFGFPITEEMQENGLTVQYFERARFEYHPDKMVQLGLVGKELLTIKQKQ